MEQLSKNIPSPEAADKGRLGKRIRNLLSGTALKNIEQSPANHEVTPPEEYNINFHGLSLIVQRSVLRKQEPRSEHIRVYEELSQCHYFIRLSDTEVENDGTRISFKEYSKKTGFNRYAY